VVIIIQILHTAVADTWLGEDLRRLSQQQDPEVRISLVVAGGQRACAHTRFKQGAKGYLLPSINPCIDTVDVRLNDVVTLFTALHIRHVLPVHPSMVGDDVVVIAGSLSGEVRKVVKIEKDLFSVQEAGKNRPKHSTTYQRQELALVKIMSSKKKGRRK